MKNIFLLSFLSFISCIAPSVCQQGVDRTTGVVLRVLDDRYLAYDLKNGDLGRFGIKISTLDQYKQVFSYCCENQLDSIDFSQYDILGLSTVNTGSSSSYILDVRQDDTNKKITYTVTEEFCKSSSPVDGRGNFVVVPKLPSNYQVEYLRNQ